MSKTAAMIDYMYKLKTAVHGNLEDAERLWSIRKDLAEKIMQSDDPTNEALVEYFDYVNDKIKLVLGL